MADLKQARKAFRTAALVLGGIAVLGALYLALPVGASNAELSNDLKQSTREVEIKEKQAAPLRGLPEKLVKTNEDIRRFYRNRLPQHQSDVSEELGKLAAREGVTLSDVKYENFDTDVPELRAVVVEAQLSGEYSHIAKFINAVERDTMFLMVDSLTLDDQKGGAVRLQLKFGTCLRPTGVGSGPVQKMTDEKQTKEPSNIPKTTANTKRKAS
jgi:Tfp pilus assembly protein PilO